MNNSITDYHHKYFDKIRKIVCKKHTNSEFYNSFYLDLHATLTLANYTSKDILNKKARKEYNWFVQYEQELLKNMEMTNKIIKVANDVYNGAPVNELSNIMILYFDKIQNTRLHNLCIDIYEYSLTDNEKGKDIRGRIDRTKSSLNNIEHDIPLIKKYLEKLMD